MLSSCKSWPKSGENNSEIISLLALHTAIPSSQAPELAQALSKSNTARSSAHVSQYATGHNTQPYTKVFTERKWQLNSHWDYMTRSSNCMCEYTYSNEQTSCAFEIYTTKSLKNMTSYQIMKNTRRRRRKFSKITCTPMEVKCFQNSQKRIEIWRVWYQLVKKNCK